MSNINFDNPWLLLLAIPLLLIAIIPFFIATNKDSRTINNKLSLVIHIVISILVTFVFAKTIFEVVITETNIYVLADVSYSSNQNLDKIDEYIENLEDTCPKNSKIGVIAFGKDYELLVQPGEDFISVKEANVDKCATDIVSALEYASTLFSDDVIKRIVIISDGKETNKSNIVSVVESLSNDDIYVDAIYLNNNLTEDTKEVQINQVDYLDSTYLNREEVVNVLIQSNVEARAMVSLSKNNEIIGEHAVSLTKGFNIVNFDLDTEVAGVFDYTVTINCDEDTSDFNNSYQFVQSVTEKTKVLFISDLKDDKKVAETLYADSSVVDFYVADPKVPFTVEELAQYDEYILSNVDVRNLNNSLQFLQSLDICVSEFGKSLITIGNTYIQSDEAKTDETLNMLSSMLPVKFGNDDQDNKVVAIVLDISRSMENLYRLQMAKTAAKATVDLLTEDDTVIVIGFYGEIEILVKPVLATNKQEIKDKIDAAMPKQGTFLGAALEQALTSMQNINVKNKEIMLISDGLPYGSEATTAIKAADKMRRQGVALSAINTFCDEGEKLLNQLTTMTGGYYYFAEDLEDIENLMLNEIKDDITDTVIENGDFALNIDAEKDALLKEIDAIPNISGFYFNNIKSGVTQVLSTQYVSKSEKEHNVPIYAYWSYGNGRVASLATSISDNWVSNWNQDNDGYLLLENIVSTNTPYERIDSAFMFNLETVGTNTTITVNAPSLNLNSVLTIDITYPDGSTINKTMVFNSENYESVIETSQVGKYQIKLTYVLGNLTYNTYKEFKISYLPEYNSFEIFEASNLYYMVSQNGKVSEDGHLELANDNSYVMTYTLDFTPIFMIICVILFVVDIMIRKLRWTDIKALFKKQNPIKGGNSNEKNS